MAIPTPSDVGLLTSNSADHSPQQQLIDRIRLNFPAELLDKKVWTLWQLETKPGSDKSTKVPYSPSGTRTSSTNPDTWATFDDVCAALQRHSKDCGIGCFNDGTYAFIDLDACIREGAVDPWAQQLIHRLGTYTELSPSGAGVHMFLRGSILGDGKKINGIELYCHSRYFTVTGQPVDTSGKGIRDARPGELEALRGEIEGNTLRPYQKTGAARAASAASSSGVFVVKSLTTAERDEKLNRALSGDLRDYGDDRSAAVYGALQLLARKHNGNEEAMRGAFEASELCASWGRKWDRLAHKEITKGIGEWKKNGSPSWEDDDAPQQKCGPKYPGREWKTFEYVLGCKEVELYDGWLPRGRCNIIAGSSGAGKTRFMVTLLHQASLKQVVFGHVGSGLPFAILFADRGAISNAETLHSLGLQDAGVDLRHMPMLRGLAAVDRIQHELEKDGPDSMPEVLFVEGADMLVNDASDMKEVSAFMGALGELAEHYYVTIVLSLGSGKHKKGEGYSQTRDRAFGSVAWSRTSAQMFQLDRVGDDTTDTFRTLTVSHRNWKEEKLDLQFRDGKLVPYTPHQKASAEMSKSKQALLDFIMEHDGETFTNQQVRSATKMNGQVAKEALASYEKIGYVKLQRKGRSVYYEVNLPKQGNPEAQPVVQ
jgi:hypothetical protein